MPTQRDHRRNVAVGPGMLQVSSAMDWYRGGHFKNDDEARGAFKLAYQQALDGMGTSTPEWMGMTDDEYSVWMRDETLPRR